MKLTRLLERAFGRFAHDNRYRGLKLAQVEAYTDLLAVAMVIDRHIAQLERERVAKLIEKLKWEGPRPSEHFINQSVRRAWGLLEATHQEAASLSYCRDIGERLKEDWLKESAFTALIEVIYADDKLEPSELDLIQYVSEAFGFEPRRTDDLIERAKRSISARATQDDT